MLEEYALQAIHETLNQRNVPINSTTIQETIIQTLNDLLKTDKNDEINIFIELLKNTVTQQTCNSSLLKTLIDVVKITKGRVAIDLINKHYESIEYEDFIQLLTLHYNGMFNRILLFNYEKFLIRFNCSDKVLFLDFICENISLFMQKYGYEYLLSTFYMDFYKESIDDIKVTTMAYNYKFTKLIYSILKHLFTKRIFQGVNYPYFVEMIQAIVNLVCKKNYLVKSISILHEINYFTYLQTNSYPVTLNSDIYLILKNELGNINGLTTDYSVIIKRCRYNPEYMNDIFTEIIKQYIKNKNEKFKKLICSILFTYGFDFLYDILRSENFKFSDFFDIFKKVNNVDLGTFIEIYADYSTENVFALFPSFMNLCTDNNGNIRRIIILIKNKLKAETNDFTWKSMAKNICLGISNLINSQLSLQNKTIILKNPITKLDSCNILNELANGDLLSLLLGIYVRHNFLEAELAFQSLFKISKKTTIINEINELLNILEKINESDTISLTRGKFLPNISDLYTLISIGELFISLVKPDSGITVKMLSLVLSKNNRIQKQAYTFLYKLIKEKKCSICICDTLISNEYHNTFTCSFKIRLLTLFAQYENCKHCNKKNANFFQKIMFELFMTLKSNSSKGRKVGFELLDDHITDDNQHEYLRITVLGLNTDDYKIINGSISALNFLILNRKEVILQNLEAVIRTAKSLVTKGKECHKNVIELYKNIILEIDTIDKRIFIDLIDTFMQRKNLYGFLRSIVLELKNKDVKISSEMKRVLTLKYKRGYKIDMKVTKKGIVELTETGKNESEESDD